MVKEAPTSPTIQNSTAPVPWNSNLMRSFQQNYAKNQNNSKVTTKRIEFCRSGQRE